jgi:hypothetical protein
MENHMSTSLLTIDTSEQLIHGGILKCVDGHWSANDESMTGRTLLVLHMTRAVRYRMGGEYAPPICEDCEKIPSDEEIKKRNAAIPKDQWDVFQGTPQPPWKIEYLVYLLDMSDPNDVSLYTFVNSTYGAKRAYNRLKEKVWLTRAFRGDVKPIVELSSSPFPTEYGKKIGPIFRPINWTSFGEPPCIGGDDKPALIGRPVPPVTAAEELSDEIPF